VTPTALPLPLSLPLSRLSAALAAAALLAGCAAPPAWHSDPALDALSHLRSAQRAQSAARVAAAPAIPPSTARPAAGPVAAAPAAPGAGSAAAPTAAPAPATATAPAPAAPPPEPRFDLVVNGASARDVFLSMVADTRYSMLMHPQVNGQLSVTLRGVTLREALESIREVYGYDFRIEGRRVTVFPPTLQTRLFTVNYLQATRQGRSEVRVSGSGVPQQGNGENGGGTRGNNDSSQITTTSSNDIWTETVEALRALVGAGDGRQVIASPQASTIAVRAMPDELRQVEAFLRASRIAVERQVMLEAKIIEVELREGFENGIDWLALRQNANSAAAAGQISGDGPASLGTDVANRLSGGALGLILGTRNFAAALTFVQSQGEVQVLSSPRVATLNNQKAVLKVGTDEYFVTNVSGGSIANAAAGTNNGATTTLPTLTLTPFFSGIALDVTPQIDEANMITLHIRPSVTAVTEKTRQIDLGAIGNYRLPLASSSVNETDTMVRVPDGDIVAIGGLMQAESARRSSGLPGATGNPVSRLLFSNRNDSVRKKELVVLIKPTIIRSADDWQRASEQALAAMDADTAPRRVISVPALPAVVQTSVQPALQPAAQDAVLPVVQPVMQVAAQPAGSP
jgi:MSHA biogenesis protein MshL